MRRTVLLLGLIATLVAVAGSPGGFAAPTRGGTLRVALHEDPPRLDPHQSTAFVDRHVFQNLFDKLVDINQNLEIVPMLATSWQISDGGRTYTFKLRPNVVFHDGTPFNAEAVKFNFERMLDPSFGSPRRSEVNLVKSVTVVDDLTVTISLEKPYSPFLAVLSDRAGMMVSPAAAKRLGKNFLLEPVGTGPYKFVEKRPLERIVLERFDKHWDKDAGLVDRIIFRTLVDENTRVANLRSGEVDIIIEPPATEIPKLKTEANIRVLERGGLGWYALHLMVADRPFDNKALRQALNASIDRRTFTKVIFADTADPANGPFSPSHWTYSIPQNSRIPERNLDLARQKLREAGQPNGFSFTMKIGQGRVAQQSAQVLQSMASEAGIKINIEIVEFGAMLSQMDAHKYEAVLIGWSGRPDPDGNIYSHVVTGGGLNDPAYSNPQVDVLLDAARILTDTSQRKRAYGQVMEILNEDLPYLFLYWPKEYKVTTTKVQGFVHIADGMLRLRTVWLTP
jgi:peptide/nickel transport system substrate-binding protein